MITHHFSFLPLEEYGGLESRDLFGHSIRGFTSLIDLEKERLLFPMHCLLSVGATRRSAPLSNSYSCCTTSLQTRPSFIRKKCTYVCQFQKLVLVVLSVLHSAV